MHLKILIKIDNFRVTILILKMEENLQHFQHMLYNFKNGKNATEMHKMIYAVYGEGAVTDPMCQKWFAKFCVEISHWMLLHGWVDQLKLIGIKLRHSLRTINVIPCGR